MADLEPQQYREEVGREEFLDVHRYARTHDGKRIQNPSRAFLVPALSMFRPLPIGLRHIPRVGPAILAPNHFSNLDHFFIEYWMRRNIHFVAKSQLFKHPASRIFLKYSSSIPVRRGRADEDTFATSLNVLGRGRVLLLYPEGGRSRTPGKLGEARRGIGRVALESGAPVLPVAVHGSDGIRSMRRRRRVPAVTVQFGGAVRLDREANPGRDRQQQAAELIFGRVAELYYGLAARLESESRLRVARGGGYRGPAAIPADRLSLS
ncbi:MAG: lysophospholipid acyltransferase family protein [Solirubrobacterales bacterium]